jgi:hypothetical protein
MGVSARSFAISSAIFSAAGRYMVGMPLKAFIVSSWLRAWPLCALVSHACAEPLLMPGLVSIQSLS